MYPKSPVYDEKSPVISGNVVSDEDYFVIKIYKNLPSRVTKSTHDKIQKLFDRYTYQYDFKREDIEQLNINLKNKKTNIVGKITLFFSLSIITFMV